MTLDINDTRRMVLYQQNLRFNSAADSEPATPFFTRFFPDPDRKPVSVTHPDRELDRFIAQVNRTWLQKPLKLKGINATIVRKAVTTFQRANPGTGLNLDLVDRLLNHSVATAHS